MHTKSTITLATMAAFAALAATTLLPTQALAAGLDSTHEGYLLDGQGEFVTNASGQCWRTGEWTAGRAKAPCDPTNQPAAAVVPPEQKIAAAPPVAVITPKAVAAPMPQKVSFSGDALFGFDKSVLRPESRTLLDDLVRQLGGATYETVTVTGHTDRFGSDKYNQKLSEQRAQAVKDYLVGSNIQAGRVDAQGRGEKEPVTNPGDCKGAKSTKVIACLQPNRRVDIEMIGTKPTAGIQ